MTDNPGWTSPGSTEPADGAPPQAARPAAAPGPSATTALPGDAPQEPPAQETPAPGTPHDTPPPTQWGAPGAPGQGGYGAPGYGAGPAWGASQPPYGGFPGWGPPPSPKPGVIPLRPLGVGELLDGAFTTVRKYWRTTLPLSLGFAAFSQTVQTSLDWWARQSGSDGPEITAALVPAVLDLLLGIVVGGLLTIVVSKGVLGAPVTLREAWQGARPQLGRLAGLTFVTFLVFVGVMVVAAVPPVLVLIVSGPSEGLGVLTAVMMIAAVLVMIWLWILLSLAAPALMLERQGVLTSLSRSRRLVRGSWWRLFGINLLTSLIVGLIASVAVLPFVFLASAFGSPDAFAQFSGESARNLTLPAMIVMAVGGTVVATITIPINAAMNVLLYIDRRIRREALDIELARAAEATAPPAAGWAGPTVPGQSTPPGA
ncbi:hypothetical protein OG871_15385 [Kitasatospora sp. NBC_00374]|uniref:DUF7847 domain-containing protein n=1 Tax=Kitasatospora sp. NBC_00374 TaxID=2975964 RepID=UPI0030E2D0FA